MSRCLIICSVLGRGRCRAPAAPPIPPDCRDLANADLQLRATVPSATDSWWHQPPADVVLQQGYEALFALTAVMKAVTRALSWS